jgi:hypothetical protein
MGATSSQGWCLFIFIVGFTLGPAGLAGLGWLVALVGFALMAVALAGFVSIKNPAVSGPASAQELPQAGKRAAKSY